MEALRELGFVDDAEQDQRAPAQTAPIQQRRWIGGPLQWRGVRMLFSPAAWCCYGAALLCCTACFILWPDLWPSADDLRVFTDPGLSVLAAGRLSYPFAALHEGWHWLGARDASATAPSSPGWRSTPSP